MRSKSGTIFDLNALRAFVVVVQAGGISDASRLTGMPKSTLSRQVRELETSLGEKLLARRGRGVAPTASGRRLFETARGAIVTLETLREEVRADPVAGRVRVAAPVMLARGPLQGVIADFLARHRSIAVEVALSDRFGAAEAERADVAFCVGVVPEVRALRQSVGFVEARLYAAPVLLAEVGAPRSMEDLAALPIVAPGCTLAGSARWSLTGADGKTVQISFAPRFVAADPDLLMAATLAGQGVCRIASFLAEPHLRSGRLVPVLESFVAERHEVFVATLRRARDAAVRCFAAETAEALRERLGAKT